MNANRVLNALSFLALLVSPLVQAADLKWNGFATLAGGKTFGDDRVYGYDNDLSFENNSLLGLQANADVGDGISAVAQIITRGNDAWNAKLRGPILVMKQRITLNFCSDVKDCHCIPTLTISMSAMPTIGLPLQKPLMALYLLIRQMA